MPHHRMGETFSKLNVSMTRFIPEELVNHKDIEVIPTVWDYILL